MRPDVPYSLAEGPAVDSDLTEGVHDVPEFILLEVLAGSGSFVDEFCQVGGIVVVLDLTTLRIT